MKSTIAKASMALMGLFAYLLLSIAMYQKAMADEEVNIWSLAQAKKFLMDDDSEWGVYYAVHSALTAQASSHAFMFSVVTAPDGDGAYDVYSSAFSMLYKCAITDQGTLQDITLKILSSYGPDTTLAAATSSFFADKCRETLVVFWAVPNTTKKRSGRT
jgi:hypothetical protein